jgi:signal transduction histidine kinase
VERGHIGLASSVERVEALGGELEIDSRPGEGTRIRTILPLRSS